MRTFNTQRPLQLSNSLYVQTVKNGGCTIGYNFESPSLGYAVGIGIGITFDGVSNINPHKLSSFIKENEELIKDGFFIGGWIDYVDNKVYFDIVDIIFNHNDAVDLAKLKGEKCIYDIENNNIIDV